MSELDIEDCISETCPWSRDPVAPEALAEYNRHVVGCRDKLVTAIQHFGQAIEAS